MYHLRQTTLAQRATESGQKRALPLIATATNKRSRLAKSSAQNHLNKDAGPSSKQKVPSPPSIRFFSLPCEIRAKIFCYAVTLEYPLSLKFRRDVMCLSPTCGLSSDPQFEHTRRGLSACFDIFRTCPAFRAEAFNQFVNGNTWRLEHIDFVRNQQTSRLQVEDNHNPAQRFQNIDTSMPTMRSLEKIIFVTRTMPYMVHFFTAVDVSCRGNRELLVDWPDHVRQGGREESEKWLKKQIEGNNVQYGNLRTEKELAGACGKRVQKLMDAHKEGYCRPRSLTIEVSMHETQWVSSNLNQCGLTLNVNIVFFDSDITSRAPKVKAEIKRDSLEPKRAIFQPLLGMGHIKSVTVERRWVLAVKDPHSTEGSCFTSNVLQIRRIDLIPMRLRFRFNTVDEMIDHAGANFRNFRRLGLTEAQIKVGDVLSVSENRDVHLVEQSLSARGTQVRICPTVELSPFQEMNQEEKILREKAYDDGT